MFLSFDEENAIRDHTDDVASICCQVKAPTSQVDSFPCGPTTWFAHSDAWLGFGLIPAIAVPLLLVGLFQSIDDLFAAQVADRGRNEIDQRNWGNVAGSE